MKHVFFVNSNITELVSFLSIIWNKLSYEDVLIVPTRNRKTNLLGTYPHKNIDDELISSIGLRKLFCSASIKKLNKMRKSLQNLPSPYIVYLPQSSSLFFRMLIRSKSCKAYNYIEEGDMAYTKCQRREPSRLIQKIPLLGLLFNKKYYHDGYQNLYCISEKAFNFSSQAQQNKIILNNFFVVNENYNSCLKPNDTLLIVPNYKNYNEICCFLSVAKENFKIDSIKLHPDHLRYKNKRENMISYIQKVFGLQIPILDDSINIEAEMTTKKLKLIGGCSSLKRYAKIFGSTYITLEEVVPNIRTVC